MTDVQKAHTFDKRAYEAIDAIEEVCQEMEAATYTVSNVPPAKDDPAAERNRFSS